MNPFDPDWINLVGPHHALHGACQALRYYSQIKVQKSLEAVQGEVILKKYFYENAVWIWNGEKQEK